MRLVDIDDIRVMKFLSEEDDPSESDGEREYRNGWNDALTAINDIQPSAELDLIAKIQNGIKVTDADDEYSCGMRNGMRWCISLIDDKEPVYENCPSAQQWIPFSERLPEANQVVLLAFSHNAVVGYWIDILPDGKPIWYAATGNGWATDIDCENYGYPTAWMPVPEFYKEGEDDEP